MTTIEYIKGVWGLSGRSWLVYGVYISICIERFIVTRYEQETNLLNAVYFTEHATFTRNLPDFFSSALYTAHLLTFIWGWNYFRKRRPYRDINEAHDVLRHFTDKEIRQAKWFAISGFIFLMHGALYYIFRAIWPEVFD